MGQSMTGSVKVAIIEEIIKCLNAMPIDARPWNVAKDKTVAYNDLANQLLLLPNISSLTSKPAVSTVVDWLHKLKTEADRAAQEYEHILSNMAFETPPAPYTLWKSEEGEIQELGSIQSASLGEFFKFTAIQIDNINNSVPGTEERASVRTSLHLRELMVELGQQELRAPPVQTAVGRKTARAEQKIEKDISKVEAMTNSESWAKENMPDGYAGEADWANNDQKRRKRGSKNEPFVDNESLDVESGVIGLSHSRERAGDIFADLTEAIATWEVPAEVPVNVENNNQIMTQAIASMQQMTAQNNRLIEAFINNQQASSSTAVGQVIFTPASHTSIIENNDKSCGKCTALNGFFFIHCSACGTKFP